MLENDAVPANVRQAMMELWTVHLQKSTDPVLADAKEKAITLEGEYLKKIDDLHDYIRGHSLESEESFDSAGVRVTFTKGYTLVKYDKKVLDELLIKNPAISEMVGPARKETNVKPKIAFKVDLSWEPEPEPVDDKVPF